MHMTLNVMADEEDESIDKGCQFVQGYYFSKPLMLEDALQFYKKIKYDS